MSIIRDPSLASKGKQKIEWVKDFMPTLTSIGKRLAENQTFAGHKIGMSIHMEAKTAYLATVLRNAGAKVYATGCNPLSTQDDVAAGLAAEEDIEVYAIHGVDEKTYRKHINAVLDNHPDLIIDDGGDLVEAYRKLPRAKRWDVLGGCEETTTGVRRLRELEFKGKLPFPMLNINDARCKHYYDNRYGTGQSVWNAIMQTTNTLIAGATVVVAGYGYCGRGIAMRAKGLGAKVIITEIDPVKALEAYHDGFEVCTMDDAAPIGEYFITATGCKDVITDRHFDYMKNNAFLANAGHFDVEINLKQLKQMATRKYERRDGIIGYVLDDGRTLNVLAEGRLVNLAAGNGHPAEIMDMSFSLQILGLEHLATNNPDLVGRYVYDFPDFLDNNVARTKLKHLGITIDEPTLEQRDYLGISMFTF